MNAESMRLPLLDPRVTAALDGVPSHIAILDAMGSIIYVNEGWREFATRNGSTDLRAYFGVNYLDVCRRSAAAGDAIACEAFAGIGRVISGQAQRFRQRYPCHGEDGERWFMMTVTRASHGQEVVIAHDDITALVHAERESAAEPWLMSTQASGEGPAKKYANKNSVFIATIDHEYRTPLNAIIGFAEIIRDQLFGNDLDRYSSYAADIHESGSYLLKLTREILELAKIEAGKFELQETFIKLSERVQLQLKAISAEADRRKVEVSAAAIDSGIELFADEAAFDEILFNLLSNAVNFTSEGGCVSFSAALRPNGCLALVIKDTGIGMTGAEIGRAAEPFQRAKAVAENLMGSGLGLSLALRLSELHGGSLNISSAPGFGTTVSVEFPPWRTRVSTRRRISRDGNVPNWDTARVRPLQ